MRFILDQFLHIQITIVKIILILLRHNKVIGLMEIITYGMLKINITE